MNYVYFDFSVYLAVKTMYTFVALALYTSDRHVKVNWKHTLFSVLILKKYTNMYLYKRIACRGYGLVTTSPRMRSKSSVSLH